MASPPKHTLDQLVVLEAIADEGSFAAAARRLHRVPSAVSYAVGALEDALGVPVFDRSGHRAELTEAGRRVLAAGQAVLRSARALDGLGDSLSLGWEPSIQVVVDGSLPMPPIIDALRAFTERGPATRVRLDVEYQGGVAEVFLRDQADLMLVLEHDGDPAHEARPLPPFEMVLVAHRDHPLAQGPTTREALLEQVELVVKDSSSRFADSPRQAWFGSHHVLYLSDFHSKRLAILAQAGFGWMPGHLVDNELQAELLRVVDLPSGNRWTYRPDLVTRGDVRLGPAGQLLRGLILERLNQKN